MAEQAAMPVNCTVKQQCGYDILVGKCPNPKCFKSCAVNGPGKFLCTCGTLQEWAHGEWKERQPPHVAE